MYYGRKQRAPIRPGKCKARNCNYNAWAHGLCKMHQYYWAKDQPIPKYKKKPPKPNNFGFSSQLEMFMSVVYLAPRPIICPVSGTNITKLFSGEPKEWISCCAHILAKGKFPLFKLNPANIILIDPKAHRLYDQGTEAQRIASGWDFSIIEQRRQILLKQYDDYKNERTYNAENSVGDTDDAAEDQGTEAQGQA